MATTTSVYAAGWRALHRILAAVSLPSDMQTLVGVGVDGQPTLGVFFAGFPNGAEPQEYVLVPAVNLDSENEPVETFRQPVHEETITFEVRVQTARPGVSQWATLERLEDLTGLVEQAIDDTSGHSATTGADLSPSELAPFQGRWHRVGATDRNVFPLESGGFAGLATVRLRVIAVRR